jgi:DNA polymerase
MQPAVAHDFRSWRAQARSLLRARISPEEVAWHGPNEVLPFAFEARAGDQTVQRVPRPLVNLLEVCACYDDPGRWALMYRVLWRVTRGGEPALLGDAADPDVRRLSAMAKAVAKEVHRMHAFLRFRETRDADGAPLYAAWFEPEHDVLAKAAPFFVERFGRTRWVIVTPRGAARWDGERLEMRHEPRNELNEALPADLHDPQEALWRTYYASIFNPARLNRRLQEKEMPRRYWAHLPEARDIPALAQAAGSRVQAMHEAVAVPPRWSARVKPLVSEPVGGESPHSCRRCPLHARATQAVCGYGPAGAAVMLVGEQPGDEEDLKGRPFVGPAGKVLDRALAAAELPRAEVYLTNAVKHFKWEPRGKRRLHRTPAQREVDACAEWLEEELSRVAPRVIVALGATAAYALTGRKQKISALRGDPYTHPSGAALFVTYHPSAILRAEDANAFYGALCEDLSRARRLALQAG